MVDRHWFGDVSLAILVALPFVAFAQPRATVHKATVSPAHAALATTTPSNGRISLLG